MKAMCYPSDGSAGEERELPVTPFDGVVNRDALHQVVTAVLANRRQGTASTKTRSTVRGGSRKPWRQKGTGRARAGSVRSPLWRGGSVVFGPQPRSHNLRVPKRLRRLAISSALNARALDGDLALIEAFDFDAPKTRRVVDLINRLDRTEANTLLLTAGNRRSVYLSARNLPDVRVLPWNEASAYDILWADFVLVEADAFGAETSDADVEDAGMDGEGKQ